MKLKLDENLSRHLKPDLLRQGHDVLTVADEALLSEPDTVVGAAARAEHRMLFTLDVEFGDLRKYPPGSHPGIVVFRPRSLGPQAVNSFVQDFAKTHSLNAFTGCLVIVDETRVRVRPPPTPPSGTRED